MTMAGLQKVGILRMALCEMRLPRVGNGHRGKPAPVPPTVDGTAYGCADGGAYECADGIYLLNMELKSSDKEEWDG